MKPNKMNKLEAYFEIFKYRAEYKWETEGTIEPPPYEHIFDKFLSAQYEKPYRDWLLFRIKKLMVELNE